MSSPVVGVSSVASVPRVVGLLRMTSHNGFPVLAPPEDLGDGSGSLDPDGRPRRGRRKRGPRRLLGMILRSQLLVLLERGAFCDAEGASRMLHVPCWLRLEDRLLASVGDHLCFAWPHAASTIMSEHVATVQFATRS